MVRLFVAGSGPIVPVTYSLEPRGSKDSRTRTHILQIILFINIIDKEMYTVEAKSQKQTQIHTELRNMTDKTTGH